MVVLLKVVFGNAFGGNIMDQPLMWTDDMNLTFEEWCYQETDNIERKRQALRKEKGEIERERRKLEREKRDFLNFKNSEGKRIENEKKFFETKWRILEEELKKVADEKVQVEKQRNFYRYLTEHEKSTEDKTSNKVVRGDMFFVGVEDKQSLKKRYKDLIKIYHPDNVAGDIGTIQEINREYDRLQEQYQ